MMAVLLAGPYWILGKFHLTLRSSPILAVYLLTLIGVTLPVAASGGLIYKMGRVFQLPRPLRCALAMVVVFSSGLISYAVVLNSHALAAVFVLGSAATLIHVANARKPRRNIWWLAAGGACAGLAMALDPPAAAFPIPFLLAIFTMRWPIVRRSAAAALFAAGVAPPLYLHLAFNYPITGDWKPALLHSELTLTRTGSRAALAGWGSVGADLAPVPPPTAAGDTDQTPVVGWAVLQRPALRLGGAIFGDQGLLSHFPIVLIGLLGVGAVLRRHWPGSAKALAMASLLGAAMIVIGYSLAPSDPADAMFGNPWFVVFLPLIVFWGGNWLRSRHRAPAWAAAGLLLVFSAAVSVIGATDPLPRGGYDQYTALAAAHRLFAAH
jgi:hypothetical protein